MPGAEPTGRPDARSLALRGLVATLLLAYLLVVGLVVQQGQRDQEQALAEAELSTQRLALALENALLAPLVTIDIALLAAIDEHQRRTDDAAFDRFLREQQHRLPWAEALGAADAEGRLRWGAGRRADTPPDISARSDFRRLREGDDALVTGVPQRSVHSGRMVLPMARALRGPDGRFQGIVFALIDVGRIDALFSGLGHAPGRVVTLLGHDRLVIARHPPAPGTERDGTPATVSAPPTVKAIAEARRELSFRVVSSVDGVDRVNSLRRLGDYPLYLLAGSSVDQVLAPVRRRHAVTAALVMALGASVLVAGLLLQQAWRRQARALDEVRARRDELQASEARFRSLTDGLEHLCFVADAQGMPSYYSPQWRAFTGLDTAAMLADARLTKGCVHPDDFPAMLRGWQAAVAAGTPVNLRYRLRRHDGAWRHFDARALPQRDAQGRVVSWVGSATDVTELVLAHEAQRRAKQAADEASRAKSGFLAMMGHEMRTPLNGVMGFAQLGLHDASLPAGARRQFQVILDSARHLLELINDLLDFSKIEAGRLDLHPQALALRPLLDEVAGLVAERARAQGNVLRLQVADALPPTLVADPTRLRQVLLNLLSNAVKFTHQGQVTLRAEREGDWLRLDVVDTGVGIDAAMMARLYQPFEQATRGAAGRTDGTGLGLAITHRLVGLMGGRIGVSSQPGQGTCFTVHLPGLPATAAAAPLAAPPVAEAPR